MKVSILMLIVAMLIVYLITRLLDGLFVDLNGFLGFSVNLLIVLVITWQVLIWLYYKINLNIIKQLDSFFLRLVSTRFVSSYFYTLLKFIRFCGQVSRSFTSGFGLNLLLLPLIVVFVWIIFMIYTPLAVTPINEKLLSDTMNNATKTLDNVSPDIYRINKNVSAAQNALTKASPEIVMAKDHLINASSVMVDKDDVNAPKFNSLSINKVNYSITEASRHLSNVSTSIIGANSSVYNASATLANLTSGKSVPRAKIFGNLTAIGLHIIINETTLSFLLVIYYYWKSILALWLLGLFLISAMRSRKLMVIEEFVDNTNTNGSSEGQSEKDSKDKNGKSNQNKSICKGLNVLLASRLIYLNDVFRGVNEDRNIMTASGVDVSMPATVQVDELSDLLQGAITPESKLELGPFQMPVSILLYPIQRLFKGPRILGSLHKDGDKTILMAQITGWNRPQSWRVCDPICIMDPEHPENRDKHKLEDMVYELAYRIFTDITYGDSFSWSQKWKATFKFSEGLSKYRDCLRTDKDKKLNLKMAEKLFIETLAEDLDFTAAYYNLGVVYTELKQQQAAKVAFLKAIDKDTTKKRWEAYYALGQNIFESAMEDFKAIETLKKKIVFGDMPISEDYINEIINQYEEVIRLCKHVIDLREQDEIQLDNLDAAKVYDLKGLAEKGKSKCYNSMKYSEGTAADLIKESINDHQKSSMFAITALFLAEFYEMNIDRFLHITSECLLDLSCANDKMADIFKEKEGYNEKAERILRLAITIKPENPSLHYKLGNVCINNPIKYSKNITKGIQAYETANNIAPYKSNYLIAMASARGKNKKRNQDDKTSIINSCKKALYSNLDIDCDSIFEIIKLYKNDPDEDLLLSLAFPDGGYLYRLAMLENFKEYDKLGKLGNVYRKRILSSLNTLNESNFEGYKCMRCEGLKNSDKCLFEGYKFLPCGDFAWIYAQIVIALSKLYEFGDEGISSEERNIIEYHLLKAKNSLEKKTEEYKYGDERIWMEADDYFTLGCLYNEMKSIGVSSQDDLLIDFNNLSVPIPNGPMLANSMEFKSQDWVSERDKSFNEAEELLKNKRNELKDLNDNACEYALYSREYINMEIKIGQLYLKESSKKIKDHSTTNKMEDAVNAHEHLKRAINELKDDPEEIRRKRLRVHEACSLKNKGDYKNALVEAQKARILNPLNDFDFTHLGEIYFELDEFKKAKEEWDNALFWTPDKPETYVNIGRSYLERAKLCRNKQNNEESNKESSKNERISALNNAETNLQKALVLYEKNEVRERGQTRYILGRTYMELGEYFKAVPHFKIVYKTMSKSSNGDELVAGLNLGSALLKLRSYNECEEVFEEIIDNTGQIRDDDRMFEYGYDRIPLPKARAWAKLGLAYSYIHRNANLKRALELIIESSKDLQVLKSKLKSSETKNFDMTSLKQAYSKCCSVQADCLGLVLYKYCILYGGKSTTICCPGDDFDPNLAGFCCIYKTGFCKKSMVDQSICRFERAIAQADARSYVHLGMACEFKSRQIKEEVDKSCLIARSIDCCKLADELDIKDEYKDLIKDLKERLNIKEKAPTEKNDEVKL